MTNTFRILWFEDDTTWFTMESKRIERELRRKYGFQAELQREYGAEFNSETLKNDNQYDLVLMDYKLAAGNTGEKIIELIRDDAILTDIILYSSQYKDMLDALKKETPFLDGVFFADRRRELFEGKLFGVIHKIVRRSEDIVNLRGFFLDKTSNFEIRVTELLKLSWDKLPDLRKSLTEAMLSSLDNSLKAKQKTIDSIKQEPDIFNAANSETQQYVIGISGRLGILSIIISFLIDNDILQGSFNLEDLVHFKRQYQKEIGNYRNALSHKKYNETTITVNNTPVTVDKEFHRKLRENVTKYDLLLSQLEECITKL